MSPPEARRILRAIVEFGTVRFARHLDKRCQERKILRAQVMYTLERGIVEPAEFENGGYRYRIRGPEAVIVVEIETKTLAVVISAWRPR